MSTQAPHELVGLPRLLRQRALVSPDSIAIVEGDEQISYGELWKQVEELTLGYVALGLEPGDRVALALENSSAYVIAYYAALCTGLVPALLNPANKARELAHNIQHAGARLLVVDASNAELDGIIELCDSTLLLLASTEQGRAAFRAGTSGTRLGSDQMLVRLTERPAPRSTDLATLIYTSGTTAKPKAVMLSHDNLLANVRGIVFSLGLREDERCLSSLPFFYAYGASILHTHLSVGACVIIGERATFPARVLGQISRSRATSLALVPSLVAMLFRNAARGEFDLSRVARVTIAGGACRSAELERLRAGLPQARVYVMYGQTEATARLCCLPAELLDARIGSAGLPLPDVELEIRDEAGDPLPPGRVGEVFARGPNVMLGYYRDPDATSAVLRDGWLRTGDVGHLDQDGFLYLQGRRTDIIKTGAHRVNPREIEEVIGELAGVEGAAAIGIPDDVLGEMIVAFVQQSGSTALTAEAIQRHCRTRLPLHKLPRRIELVSALPLTPSGKLERRSLLGTL